MAITTLCCKLLLQYVDSTLKSINISVAETMLLNILDSKVVYESLLPYCRALPLSSTDWRFLMMGIQAWCPSFLTRTTRRPFSVAAILLFPTEIAYIDCAPPFGLPLLRFGDAGKPGIIAIRSRHLVLKRTLFEANARK